MLRTGALIGADHLDYEYSIRRIFQGSPSDDSYVTGSGPRTTIPRDPPMLAEIIVGDRGLWHSRYVPPG